MATTESARARLNVLARHVAPATAQSHAAVAPAQKVDAAALRDSKITLAPPNSEGYHSERCGGYLIAQTLAALSPPCRFVFCLAGGHVSPILTECEKVYKRDEEERRKGEKAGAVSRLRVVDTRHEANAVFAADACVRLAGGTAACAVVTAGPGVTNTVTAIRNASMAQSPLVLFGGAAVSLLKGQGSLQDVDQENLMRPVCKAVYCVKSAASLVHTVKLAFQTAQSGVPGPVFIEVPIDVLYPPLTVTWQLGLLDKCERAEFVAGLADGKLRSKRVIVPWESRERLKLGFGGARRGDDADALAAYLNDGSADATCSRDTDSVFFEKASSAPDLPALPVRVVMNLHLRKLYKGAFPPTGDRSVFAPLPLQIPTPTGGFVWEVLQRLGLGAFQAGGGVKRPVILLGSQTMLEPARARGRELAGQPAANPSSSAYSAEALREALCWLGAPCFCSGMTRGLFGGLSENSENSDSASGSVLVSSKMRKQALAQSDFVLLLGTPCDFRLSYGRILPKKGKKSGAKPTIVAVNRSASELSLNATKMYGLVPGFFALDLQQVADPTIFLFMLVAELQKAQNNAEVRTSWRDSWTAPLQRKGLELESAELERNSKGVAGGGAALCNPVRVLRTFGSVVAEKKAKIAKSGGAAGDTVLIGDGGDFVATAAYVLRPSGPFCWLDPGPFGTLGCGGGFALGAALLYPQKDKEKGRKNVAILWGDGACGFSLAEFDTFHRFGVSNVLALVGNDGCWTQIARDQGKMLGSEVSCELTRDTRYDLAAAALAGGAPGAGVTVSADGSNGTVAEAGGENSFEGLLRRELLGGGDGTPTDSPLLVNILIGTTSFRDGSISV